jgi:hypothetical protein
MKRRSTAEPPERNSSTLIPVSAWNMLAIFWAVLTGVDVYQVTAPSFLAAVMSTGSGVNDWALAAPTNESSATQAMVSVRINRSSPQRPGRLGRAG